MAKAAGEIAPAVIGRGKSKVIVCRLFGGDGNLRIAMLASRIKGIESELREGAAKVYYDRPGSKQVQVQHSFDAMLEAWLLLPREGDDA